ncbi:MAG: hypothetical protein Q9163_000349 [Psora crenata]
MFDVLPNLLSSIITILFPIFASYKALSTSDPAQLTPWLMYWVVLSCFSLFDYWTWFILSWLPFYAYVRLVVLSYLVLPQTQGAKFLYQSYIHPFLEKHEKAIDRFIISAHDQAKSAGLNYFKKLVDLIKENLLGIPRKPAAGAHPRHGDGGNYAQSLLARFNVPSARQGVVAPANDFYGFLSSALGVINASSGSETSREEQVDSLSRSGTLVPQGMTSASEKITFLSTQLERMTVLLDALDKEASQLRREAAIERDVDDRLTGAHFRDGSKESKSEAEYEEIGPEERGMEQGPGKGKVGGGSWMPWAWGSTGDGKATGVDMGTRRA